MSLKMRAQHSILNNNNFLFLNKSLKIKFLFRKKMLKISYRATLYMSLKMRAQHSILNNKNWKGRRE